MKLISRPEALLRGLPRYFTGKPCPRGHVCERQVSGRVCVECVSEKAAAKRRANPGARKAEAAQWYSANRDQITAKRRAAYAENSEATIARVSSYRALPDFKERLAAYRLRNRDAILAYYRSYARGNVAARRINEQNRAARMRATGGVLSPGLAGKLLKLQRGCCANCTRELAKVGYHLDHKVPISLGGVHDDSNIELLCPDCNLRKHAKDPIEWAREQGRLI